MVRASLRRNFIDELSEFTSTNRRILILSSLFLLGVLWGTWFFTSSPAGIAEEMALLCERHLTINLRKPFHEVFLSSFLSVFWLYAALLFLGFSAIAQPVIALIPLFHGLGVGFTAACLYSGTSGADLILTSLLILPSSILSGIVVIMASRSAMYLSICFFKKMSGRGEKSMLPVLKRYAFQFAVYFVFCVFTALTNAGTFYIIFNFIQKG